MVTKNYMIKIKLTFYFNNNKEENFSETKDFLKIPSNLFFVFKRHLKGELRKMFVKTFS